MNSTIEKSTFVEPVSPYKSVAIGGNDYSIMYVRAYLDDGKTRYMQILFNGQTGKVSLLKGQNGVETTIFSIP